MRDATFYLIHHQKWRAEMAWAKRTSLQYILGENVVWYFILIAISISLIFNVNCIWVLDDGVSLKDLIEFDEPDQVDQVNQIPQIVLPPHTTRAISDSDNDGLSDADEVWFGTESNDPDTDDDGVLDGAEGLTPSKSATDPANDPDGDGVNNAKDADSDGDLILDGTEKGITTTDLNLSATDQSKGHFAADSDPTTTTDMTKADTDGDTLLDGDEDRNVNGKYEPSKGETDPNFKDFDNDGLHDDTEDLDDDNDGMPDKFEYTYKDALNPLDPTDRDLDYDDDGFTNYREYLGNDNAEGNEDWSNPEDPTSKPNIAPTVTFKAADSISTGGETIPRISIEAKQRITLNDTLLTVTDENEDQGLTYKWDWGDGSDVYTKSGVRPKSDAPQEHTYDTAGVYTIKLQVIDNINNIGEGKLSVDVTLPTGATEIVMDIPSEKDLLEDKKTIQRSGWIAYNIADVKKGERITIDFSAEPSLGTADNLSIRVFIISEKDFNIYKQNSPETEIIPRKYEEYWSGPVNSTVQSKKIVIKVEEDDTLLVIFDNSYYKEGKEQIVFDEPVEYAVSIRRERLTAFTYENWIFLLSLISISIVIILIIALYTKMHRDKLLENKIRAQILEYINENPGVHYRKILSDLNLQMGVLTHHLHMLEQQYYLKSHHDNMYRRYYLASAKMDTMAKLSDPRARILHMIQSRPGISQSGIARDLNQNRKSVHYHVKRLSDEGLVHIEPNGRESKCFYYQNCSTMLK